MATVLICAIGFWLACAAAVLVWLDWAAQHAPILDDDGQRAD